MAKNRGKFVELAEKRVVKTIKDIRLIGNLANRSNYSYTKEDVNKILSALDSELKALKNKFDSSKDDNEIDFKL